MRRFHDALPSMSHAQSDAFNRCISETLEKMDSTLPFHNDQHVINVFDAVIQITNQMDFLNSNEKTLLACAGMMHDIAHPGISNTQHSLWNSPLLQQYGHCSPNERMHADLACIILRKNNIFRLFPCFISEGEIEQMILATDMVEQFNVLNCTNSIKNTSRQNLYNIIIKCADLFHLTKTFDECSYWARKYNQEAGLLMNPEHEQKFLENMGLPLFKRLKEICPCESFEKYIECIEENSRRYGSESCVSCA